MANNPIKKRKASKINRTAANIMRNENCCNSSGIPYAHAKSQMIHSKTIHHKAGNRKSRLHRFD